MVIASSNMSPLGVIPELDLCLFGGLTSAGWLRSPSDMKNLIKEYVYRFDNVCFPDLVAQIPNAAGERMLCHYHENLVLWDGMSLEFVLAFEALLEEGTIGLLRVDREVALRAHAFHRKTGLEYPTALRIQKYAELRWLPTLICRT